MNITRMIVWSLCVATPCAALADQASEDNWWLKAGINKIAPQVDSGNLSAPSLPNTKIDVGSGTSAIFTLGYEFTDHLTAEGFAGLPYKHEIDGDGAIKGVGKIGELRQVSPTVIFQYRFLERSAPVRPYAGIGATYGYFYGEKGTNILTSMTNPGGDPTRLDIDSAWGTSLQLGVAAQISGGWFLDLSAIKTYIKTTAHLSTGQQITARLDPISTNVSLGYRF
ncbi:MAG: OmpW family outer membrane protein [Steroidobacteraceae bacterium]